MSDCWCDYDPPEFWSKATHKAKKQHRCYECRGLIEVGESYESISGKWEGYFDTFKTCSRCVDLRTWVRNNVPCFCWAHGNMLDDAKDAVEAAVERAGDEVAGLRFGFARRLHVISKLNAERQKQVAAA